jgi:hypothetical protein
VIGLKILKKLERFYKESPAISAFNESQKQYKNMTRQDILLLMVAMMSLAGMVGPKTLAYIVLGKQGIPDYDGKKTGEISVADIWDKLNLNDHDKVKRYIYECGCLRHPVSNTHKVAAEDFTARVGNKDVKFKKGTIIYIPMILAGLNTSVYGKTTFDFDHNTTEKIFVLFLRFFTHLVSKQMGAFVLVRKLLKK